MLRLQRHSTPPLQHIPTGRRTRTTQRHVSRRAPCTSYGRLSSAQGLVARSRANRYEKFARISSRPISKDNTAEIPPSEAGNAELQERGKREDEDAVTFGVLQLVAVAGVCSNLLHSSAAQCCSIFSRLAAGSSKQKSCREEIPGLYLHEDSPFLPTTFVRMMNSSGQFLVALTRNVLRHVSSKPRVCPQGTL